uniref:NR LBD domain-containing protein n=1 Tax=Acrobeloides nanus TaxID=290746 RepID=A0A914E9S3_9BILA
MKLERVRRKSKVHVPTPEVPSPAFPQSIGPTSTESVIKSPIQDSPCSSASRISDKKQFINVQPLEQKIKDILSQSPTSLTLAPGIRLTFLQQLCFHFPLFYDEVKSKQPVIVTTVFNRFRHFQFIQRWWLELAKLLMKCEQFAQLNFEDKWLLYKHAWLVFFKLERYFSSIQVFGTSYNDNRILYDDTTALDYSHPDLTVAEFETLEKREQWKNLMMPILEKYIKSIVNPMKALQISQFELIYMLAQVLWTSQCKI